MTLHFLPPAILAMSSIQLLAEEPVANQFTENNDIKSVACLTFHHDKEAG